ncbi:MAG: glycoside hydrolase family 15 protein [Acidimicrobiales bacterium]
MERTDGFAPIEAYAAIGDGRTTALIAQDGAIDWWPLPDADSPPGFASIVSGERGGTCTLRPAADFTATRRYLEDTNVLETTYRTADGEVTVTDSSNVSDTGQLPWNELARVVRGVHGAVEMRWVVAPGDRFSSARPWTEKTRSGVPIVHLADQAMGLVCTQAGEPVVGSDGAHGSFTTAPRSSHLLAIVSTDAEPLFLPAPASIRARLDESVEWWRAWCRRIRYDGPWEPIVRRSALVLKLLTFSTTGAILAAPTTSLPEILGGEKNYDYRFAWVRDMAFAIGAMEHLGIEAEVHKSLSWLVATVRRTAPDVHVFYTLGGEVANVEDDVPERGYRDSRPVQSGNKAESQTQLESFGALFDPLWTYVAEGHQLDGRTAEMISSCADRVCDIWMRKDAGLWELTESEHYTASKVGCWTALDRAVRLADAGQVDDRHRHRWQDERDAIAKWVRGHCWSDTKGAYTFFAGTDALDAAVLLSARIGFDQGERMSSTIDALRAELGRGPLLYRYSDMVEKEGAFLACSFWMVEALALTGRVREARALMEELVERANDVGLYSEEMDPETGAMLGNFPQALTHLSLINAAAVVHQHVGDRAHAAR